MEGTGALVLDAAAVVRPVREALRRAGLGAVPEGRWLDLPEARVAWSRDGESWAEVEVGLRLGPDWGTARLHYDIRHLTCPTGPQHQTVALTTTPCRFGGLRWWWRCPETGGRCARLCLPNGGRLFVGGAAYGLAYASQREDAVERVHRRIARVHRRLGARAGRAGRRRRPGCGGCGGRTHERLGAELRDAEAALHEAFLAGAARPLGWRRWG